MTTETVLPPLELNLPPLHDSQREIAQRDVRFKVVCCGRRWGKTLLGIVLCLREALKGGRVWWVAPSYKQALEGWSYLQRLCLKMPPGLSKTLASELVVNFYGGGSVQIRTGDDPDSLRGAGLNGVVLDEAATMKPEVWELVLRPALADRQGWALFISTPQHFNWFYDLYALAEDPLNGDWAAWQHPTWDNPFIPAAEIEIARRDMAQEDFDQEFGASFTAVGGAVFRELAANRMLYLRECPAGLEYRRTGVGMDWGTTPQHQASVVCGSSLSSGVVWIRSAWLSASGSSDDWYDEALRCKRDYAASFARVDRSQSSAIDHLKSMRFTADKGVPNVDRRIGDLMGLIKRKAVFFDTYGPGVRQLFNSLCAYHRNREGRIVEEQDDDVDACCYLTSELVSYSVQAPQTRARGAHYERSRTLRGI